MATAIEEQDAKALSALPGIGPAMAERIIAKLRRKVPKFALMVARDETREAEVEPDVVSETFEVLRTLGHSESDARRLLDAALAVEEEVQGRAEPDRGDLSAEPSAVGGFTWTGLSETGFESRRDSTT